MTGVETTGVDAEDASSCARYLHENWKGGVLRLTDRDKCRGYATYSKTLQSHSSKEQAMHTLLITNALLPLVDIHLPGFKQMTDALASWLHRKYDTVVELFFAHGLRQGPHTLQSTGFDVHQDTEDFDFIEYTVVVKLTADQEGEGASRMRVVGAAHPFRYGSEAGAAGCFLARLYHASVAPESEREHYKIAFFFRKSTKGERRAKRTLSLRWSDVDEMEEETEGEERLARRRQRVMHELSSATVAAAAEEKRLKLHGRAA